MNPDLDKMRVVELKAMCYDCMAIIEQQKNNLGVLSAKIAEKSKEVKKPNSLEKEIDRR